MDGGAVNGEGEFHCFDGSFHAGTESPRAGEQDFHFTARVACGERVDKGGFFGYPALTAARPRWDHSLVTPELTANIPLPAAPVQLFDKVFADEPWSFMLDAPGPGVKSARWSFMGGRPFLVFEARGRRCVVRRDGKTETVRDDPFRVLARLLAHYRQEIPAGAPPFLAGAVGFVSYEANRMLERLAGARPPSPGVPDLCFAFYECVLACDLARREAWVAVGGLRGPAHLQQRQAVRARELLARAGSAAAYPRPRRAPFRLTGPLRESLPRARYLRAVEAVKRAIARGDIYQANLTRRFSAGWEGDPAGLFMRLRAESPAPHAAWLNFGRVRALSSSPERFLAVRGRRVETRPIKGTRPRVPGDPPADRRQALELVRSEKDMAENVMIVDLLRNDLGRVCRPGSIAVNDLAALEAFPQVFHLTSTVQGELRAGLGVPDLLRAAFPGGSVTGAPKISSMEVLAALEPVPRDLYTGTLGWIGFNGDCDLSIVIRCIQLAGREMSFAAGGGIVSDSDPVREYAETLHKARGMLQALGKRLPGRGGGTRFPRPGRVLAGAPL